MDEPTTRPEPDLSPAVDHNHPTTKPKVGELVEKMDELIELEVEKKRNKKKKKDKDKGKEGTLGTSRGIETMFRTSYQQHVDLSSLADTKANIMISINGLIISIVIASLSSKIDTNQQLLIPTVVMLLVCLLSLVFAILSARPRITSRSVTLDEVRRDGANILFFGNFVNMREQDYIQGMTELLQNTDRLYHNMMRDIYALGAVLQRKFTLLRVSYTVFMFGLIFSVLLYIAFYIWIVVETGGTEPGLPDTSVF